MNTDKPHIINCATLEDAIGSTSALLGETPADLRTRLSNLVSQPPAPGEILGEDPDHFLDSIVGHDHPPLPDSAMFFHGTRVPKGTDFNDGLLPTGQARDRIIRFISQIADDLGVSLDGPRCHPKRGKAIGFSPEAGFDAGPHGFLIRANARAASYVNCPEFVREYCSSFSDHDGKPLIDEYKRRTQSVIVWFEASPSSPDFGRWIVRQAISYISDCLNDGDQDGCNFQTGGFDGGGTDVPRKDIHKLEWLE